MQTDWEKIQSETIEWLRFPMAVAIVFLHHGESLLHTAAEPLRSICLLFSEGICRLAVPCFFFISGYLFFHKLQEWDWDIWKAKIKRRGITLLVPYILWNMVALFAFWGYGRVNGAQASLLEQFHEYGGFRLFWNMRGGIPIGLMNGPLDGPLWFIRDLMYYVLATPAVYLFLKWAKGYGILGLYILYLAVPGSVPEGFVFFVTGAYLQYSQKGILSFLFPARRWFYWLFIPLLIITCISFGYSEYWNRFAKFVFELNGISAVFCLIGTLLEEKAIYPMPPFLAKSSFFIFALHEILILRQIATPAVHAVIPPDTVLGGIVSFFLVPAITVGICLGILWLLQKFLPHTSALLTGNRMMKPSYS